MYNRAAAITTHDTNELADSARALYVGTAGALKLTLVNNQVVTFGNVTAGTILELPVKIVWATGTTASNIVGLS